MNHIELVGIEKPLSWPTEPQQLVQQLDRLLTLHERDLETVRLQGGGVAAGLRDTLRRTLDSSHRGLLGNLTEGFETFGQLWQALHPDDRTILAGNLAILMENWHQKENLEGHLREIRERAYQEGYAHLAELITTQLGEALQYDPNLINSATLNLSLQSALKNFLDSGHKLQQREFGNYVLDSSLLPQMIASSKRRQQVPGSTPREQDETFHLEILWQNMNQPVGTTYVEISPPFHSHQTQTMLRFYTKEASGWRTNIFYVPDTDQPLAELVTDYKCNLSNRNILSAELVPGRTVALLNVTPGQELAQLANLFPLVSRLSSPLQALSGLDILRAGDAVIRPHLDPLLPAVHQVVTQIMNDLPEIVRDPNKFRMFSDKLERIIHMVNISARTNAELQAQGYSEADIQKIISGELLGNAVRADSDFVFDTYVAANFDTPLRSELNSDCLYNTASYGVKSEGVRADGESWTVKGKDGTVIEFYKKGNETFLRNCPMCGEKDLDICTSCRKCKHSATQMREWFEQGTLADKKNPSSGRESKNTKRSYKSTSQENMEKRKKIHEDWLLNAARKTMNNVVGAFIPWEL